MNNGNKNIAVITIRFFLGFFISKSFHFTHFHPGPNIFYEKNMQSNFLAKNRICCIMLYARFLTNFGSRFCKMDIFLFFKNVQNEKPPMNLDRPFFGDSKFGKLYSIKIYYKILDIMLFHLA